MSGVEKTWIEGYGWVLVFGRREDDERRADRCGELWSTYEPNEERLKASGLHGTVNIHADHGPDPKAAPNIHATIRLVDPRRKRA